MMISGNLCDTFTYDPSVMTCFTHILLKTLQELRMLSLSRSALLVVLDFPSPTTSFCLTVTVLVPTIP